MAHLLVREWHLLADMRFSDLVLWVPDEDENVFWVAAQQRPVTGPTALEDDVVGDEIRYEPDSLVTEAFMSREVSETSNNRLRAGIPVDVWAIPILRHGDVIGVAERHTNRMGVRAPGAMEDYYLEIADILTDMVHHADYPVSPASDPSMSPRVGDGLIYAGMDGAIKYASPNAVSAYRRLGMVGDLVGEDVHHPAPDSLRVSIFAVSPTARAPSPTMNRSPASQSSAPTSPGSTTWRTMPGASAPASCNCARTGDRSGY